jgi:hypothetical protein
MAVTQNLLHPLTVSKYVRQLTLFTWSNISYPCNYDDEKY